MASARDEHQAEIKKLCEGGASAAEAERRARREALDRQDERWREQGRAAAGDDPRGWNL